MCQKLDVGQANAKVLRVRRLVVKKHLDPGQVFEKVSSLPTSTPTLESSASHEDVSGMCQSLDAEQANAKIPLARKVIVKKHRDPGQVSEKVSSLPTLRRNIDNASTIAQRRKIVRAQKQKIDRVSIKKADVNPQIKKIFASQLELKCRYPILKFSMSLTTHSNSS